VVGVERSEEAVQLARELVAERKLSNVEVVCGDGRDTSLPRGSFDLVSARLVLVNVPAPHEILAEAVALARPGGLIAWHEAAWPVHTLDPPLEAWDRLYAVLLRFRGRGRTSGVRPRPRTGGKIAGTVIARSSFGGDPALSDALLLREKRG
jgi:SAM-dependent methyltransferase